MCDSTHHESCRVILQSFELWAASFVPFRQQGNHPRGAKKMSIAVNPNRRGRKAVAAKESQLDRLRAVRAVDLNRLVESDTGMSGRQKVDSLITRSDQSFDIHL